MSELARDEEAEDNHRGREQGGRRVERSITNGPGVVTLKRVNGQEPNFPPTHFFSLHHQHLSFSGEISLSFSLLLPSSLSLITTPYISQLFNTGLYFSSSW